MTVELNKAKLQNVIELALKSASKSRELSKPVDANSKMGSPREWDSVAFVAVFIAVEEEFEVELDDDDAIHFQSVESIYKFLQEILVT